MNRAFGLVVITMFVGTCALHAQGANPISTNLKSSWADTSSLLTKMADKMPDEDYRFKPTPEIQDFGQRMAHVITFNMRACSLLKGEQKPLTFTAAPTKAEIAAAMKQANDECDAAFNSLTDADVLTMVNAGRGGQRTKLALIEGNVLEHSQEVYGYMCVYLRLKGIVPPSSDRTER
jgi:DinB superfamily